jgi:hypothetical protein
MFEHDILLLIVLLFVSYLVLVRLANVSQGIERIYSFLEKEKQRAIEKEEESFQQESAEFDRKYAKRKKFIEKTIEELGGMWDPETVKLAEKMADREGLYL